MCRRVEISVGTTPKDGHSKDSWCHLKDALFWRNRPFTRPRVLAFSPPFSLIFTAVWYCGIAPHKTNTGRPGLFKIDCRHILTEEHTVPHSSRMRVKWALGRSYLMVICQISTDLRGGNRIKVDITAHTAVSYVYGRETKLKQVAQWMLIRLGLLKSTLTPTIDGFTVRLSRKYGALRGGIQLILT